MKNDISNEPIRLAKLMAQRNICSRREAEKLIESGWVKVNSQIWKDLAQKVSPQDHIEVLAKGKKQLQQKLTVLLHKPLGYVSGQEEDGYKPAVQLILKENKDPQYNFTLPFHKNLRLAPAGRLDIDSTGLLVLTENGVIAKKLIDKNSPVEKEYKVKVEGEITQEKLQRLHFGLALDGQKLKPAKVTQLDVNILRLILTEGKKRQVRRMCKLVDLKVLTLQRTRIGNISLGTLKYGQWRFLEPNEHF